MPIVGQGAHLRRHRRPARAARRADDPRRPPTRAEGGPAAAWRRPCGARAPRCRDRDRRGAHRGAARRRARHLLSARAAGQRPPRGPARCDRRAPGRGRRRRDRFGQDHPAPQDLPRARARRPRRHRPHAAAAARRPDRRRAHRRRAGRLARRRGRVLRALQRPVGPGHARPAHDRRAPARGDVERPAAAPLRHDHRRRGARAEPQHRLPARLPQADPPGAAGPEGRHHVRDDRPRPLRRALRRRAGRRGVGPHVPRRGPPPAGRGGDRPGRGDRRRRGGAAPGGPGRRARLPERRARDPRHRRRPARSSRERRGDPAALRAPVDGRAAPRLPSPERPVPQPRRAGDERRRDVA